MAVGENGVLVEDVKSRPDINGQPVAPTKSARSTQARRSGVRRVTSLVARYTAKNMVLVDRDKC